MTARILHLGIAMAGLAGIGLCAWGAYELHPAAGKLVLGGLIVVDMYFIRLHPANKGRRST